MRHQVRRRELARVLKGDDPRESTDFVGSPEHLLLEALKTATIIVQNSGFIFNVLDKTILRDDKKTEKSFDIRAFGEAILEIDKALVESINAKREQGAIKVAPFKREGFIFSDCEKSGVQNTDDLCETAQDYFRLQSDVRIFDLKRPTHYRLVFQSMNSYNYVAVRELIPIVERVYDECCDTVQLLIQYCEMIFTKLIPELEHKFFQCKLDSTSLRMEIDLLKGKADGIAWVESLDFGGLLKQHKNDFLRQLVDKLYLNLNQSVERIAALKVMHPVKDSENLTPIGRLLWNTSDNILGPLLIFVERIKVQVVSQNAPVNVADKQGFSYSCDKIITEYRSAYPDKTMVEVIVTRDRRSSDATVAKPSFGIDNPEVTLSPRKGRHLPGRKDRVKSIDQVKAQPIPPKLDFAKLPAIGEENEADQQSLVSEASQTKSLTRSGDLARLFSASPRKNSRAMPDFKPPSDGDELQQQVTIPTTTLARGSIPRELLVSGSGALGNTVDDNTEIKSEDLDEAAAMLIQMEGSLNL